MSRPKNRRFSYDARLDWLQLTAFLNKIKKEEFDEHYFNLKRKLNEEGFEPEKVRFQRAKGPAYEGQRVGPFSFVTCQATEHRMIVGSGKNAALLAAYARENKMAANPSRVDARVELEFEESQPGYGEWARNRVQSNDRSNGRNTRTQMELYDAKHADTGIRSGAKTSDIKWRLYDSGFHHQKRMDSKCWAMEVQLHKNPAKQFWGDCLEGEDIGKLCLDMVATRFNKLGITESGLADAGNYKVSGTRTIATNERKLLYLDKTCAKMVKDLAAAGFAGDVRAIFRAHGLIDENDVFLNFK